MTNYPNCPNKTRHKDGYTDERTVPFNTTDKCKDYENLDGCLSVEDNKKNLRERSRQLKLVTGCLILDVAY